MNLLGAIRSTARLSDSLFRHAFPLYALLYDWGFHVHRLAAGGALGERLTPEAPIAGGDDETHYFDVLCVQPAAARA